MKVLLMGAGGQGGPCASILSRDQEVSKIVIGDINVELAEKVKEKIEQSSANNGRRDIEITTVKVDAGNPDDVAKAAKEAGVEVIIDLVTPKFYYQVLQGALKAGVHYVSTAYDKFMWDNQLALDKKPKLFQEFQDIGKTALLGCGMSSGYTNVIARYYADQLDVVKSVKVRLAKKDLSGGKYADAVTAWNPGWDPRQALLDFKLPATVFRDKKYELKTEPFSEIEEWDFPEPMGKMAVSLHAHEEPYSIPQSFQERGIEYCDFKYYVNMQIAPIVSLGLASEEEIEVKGTKITPLEVVLSMVPKPVDSFLNENPATFAFQDANKIVSMMVEVAGYKDEKEVRHNVYIPTMNYPRQKMYDLYGSANISVALPAVIGAKMLAKGSAPTGVRFPQDLDPQEFLQVMSDTGYEHRFYDVNAAQ